MKNFFRNNAISVIFILSSVILFLFSKDYFGSGYIISSGKSLLNYISLFFFLLGIIIFLKRKNWIITFNIFLTLMLFLLAEITYFFLLDMPEKHNKKFPVTDIKSGSLVDNLGIGFYPGTNQYDFVLANNDTILRTNYIIDEYSRRFTPDHDTSRTKHALFFGCSITFGVYLEDNQTFPYHFQTISEEYNAYNYGISGTGTNHVLARMEFEDLSKQVVERDGIGVYIFFWDHIRRSIGSMARYTDWLHNAPFYKYENDKLVRQKMFANGRRIISRFYELVYQLNIIEYYQIDFPIKLNDSHFDRVSDMILQSKEIYSNEFGNDSFYIVLYPSYDNNIDREYDRFKQFLEKKQLKYFDLTKHINYGSEFTLVGDPHPNSNTNNLLAKEFFSRFMTSEK